MPDENIPEQFRSHFENDVEDEDDVLLPDEDEGDDFETELADSGF